MLLDIKNLPREALSLPIAFFDLDNTLTDADTDFLWVRWRLRSNPLAMLEYYRLMKLYRKYRKATLSEEELISFQVKRIGRWNPLQFKALCHRFFQEAGIFHIYSDARTLIEAHRHSGARVVMITAQHDMVAAPFAHHLTMDDLVGSRIATDFMKFTDPVKPFCFKDGKKRWAGEYAESAGVKLNQCAFYSDSINDVPLFEAVAFPVATNPDPALEKIAQERNWPTLILGNSNQ